MDADIPKGFTRHNGGRAPIVGRVFAYFRDGICLRCSLPPADWAGRWEWRGKPTKRPNDILAYKVDNSRGSE